MTASEYVDSLLGRGSKCVNVDRHPTEPLTAIARLADGSERLLIGYFAVEALKMKKGDTDEI